MTDLDNPEEIRRLAEERLKASSATPKDMKPVDLTRLVHELQVHQIELEMQNSELAILRDQLEASLTRYTELYDFAPIGYFSLDREGVIRQVNLAGAQLLGLERAHLINRPFSQFVSADFRISFADMLKKSLSGHARETCDISLMEKEPPDKRQYLHLEMTPDASEQSLRVIAMDISERLRLETELDRYRHHLEEQVENRTGEILELNRQLELRAHDAEAANRAKSIFLATMSHEIRTPMNAIIGLTYLLRRHGDTSPAQEDKLARIATAAEHLLVIINDILDLSKIEAGKLVLEETDFSLATLIEGSIAMITGRMRDKGLKFTLECCDLPAMLQGDQNRIRQVLLNYLGNAVKFTESGEITLRVSTLEETATDMLLRFAVEDSGIGVSEEVAGRLFQSFEQADGSTTRRYGGTGLGLAINRHLAHLLGGEVGLERRPEGGCIFWITARLGKVVAESVNTRVVSNTDQVANLLSQQCSGARILVAEDEELCRLVTEELLTAVGMTVECAENGQQAAAKAEHGDYDLILMDMQMPVMDGIESTRAIRRLPAHAKTPIVALTANAFEDDRKLCREAGMGDFLPKPVVPKDLYALLLKWLNKPD